MFWNKKNNKINLNLLSEEELIERDNKTIKDFDTMFTRLKNLIVMDTTVFGMKIYHIDSFSASSIVITDNVSELDKRNGYRYILSTIYYFYLPFYQEEKAEEFRVKLINLISE